MVLFGMEFFKNVTVNVYKCLFNGLVWLAGGG